MLRIRHLKAFTADTEILKGLSLDVHPGQIHVIMGPNGAGKSTLAKVLAGHPSYEVSSGDVLLNGENLLELDPSERSHKGLFMSFQYPLEVEGVSNVEFLRAVYNAHQKAKGEEPLDASSFEAFLSPILEKLQMKENFLKRDLNSGFSGGEKKRNEILQMAVINPKIAILDETDSGLDIDALRAVAAGINALMDEKKAIILITHYQRLLDYITPDFIHIMVDGKIVKTGDKTLALEIEKQGYHAII